MGIGIIDYGSGNLSSVKKAFDYLGKKNRLITSPGDFIDVERIVLPGVGSFGYAVQHLQKSGLIGTILEWIYSGKPYLGICLGLQLLFESSEESPDTQGFSVFRGNCKRFSRKKVPQIGWNSVAQRSGPELWSGIEDGNFFYFIHSYFAIPFNDDLVWGVTDYGMEYTSVVGKERIIAVQFHPEKSGEAGLRMLKNWVERC